MRNHGRLDWTTRKKMKKRNIPQERIRELERELKRVKGDKEILEIALDVTKDELGIDIRKKYLAKLSADQKNKDTQ